MQGSFKNSLDSDDDVLHYPHERCDLDDVAVLGEGGRGRGSGAGVTARQRIGTRQHWPNLPTVHTVTRLEATHPSQSEYWGNWR